eukprot:TRINITY_DN5058_c2_g5_i1.p5 TRINITY_DN5058_c2_g5~~TRINITY_DN5058_c2_g5_i1.p5  ORF type:complete len:105 (-),score=5.34 TRINITY_DN5058_c2_g5_i1:632-946(-)
MASFQFSCLIVLSILLLCQIRNISGQNCECGCLVESGVDYNGADLRSPIIGVKSVEDCQLICSLEPQCRYFAYATSGDSKGKCWTKGYGVTTIKMAERTSGRSC